MDELQALKAGTVRPPSGASLLPLKARMVRSEAVEALLHGCATWTPLKGYYTKLRTTDNRMLLRILGAWCKSPNKRILSYKNALQRTGCESVETTMRTRRLLWSGALLRMGDQRLPKVLSGELESAGKEQTDSTLLIPCRAFVPCLKKSRAFIPCCCLHVKNRSDLYPVPSLSYSSRQRNEFPWSQANPK